MKLEKEEWAWQCDHCKSIKKDNLDMLKKLTLCHNCGRYSLGEIAPLDSLRSWRRSVRG